VGFALRGDPRFEEIVASLATKQWASGMLCVKKKAGQRKPSGLKKVSNQTKTELCVTVSIFSEPWFLSIPRA
jgi:hypothetical protein